MTQGTDNFEDMPPDEMPHDIEPASSNGNGSSSRASTSQMFVGSESSYDFNLPKELLTAPGDFAELMPRSNVSADVAAALIDIVTEDDQYRHGSIDPTRVAYLTLAMSPSINGLAREQAIRASVGNQSWTASLKSMGDRIFGDRSKNNGTGQRDGPS